MSWQRTYIKFHEPKNTSIGTQNRHQSCKGARGKVHDEQEEELGGLNCCRNPEKQPTKIAMKLNTAPGFSHMMEP